MAHSKKVKLGVVEISFSNENGEEMKWLITKKKSEKIVTSRHGLMPLCIRQPFSDQIMRYEKEGTKGRWLGTQTSKEKEIGKYTNALGTVGCKSMIDKEQNRCNILWEVNGWLNWRDGKG